MIRTPRPVEKPTIVANRDWRVRFTTIESPLSEKYLFVAQS